MSLPDTTTTTKTQPPQRQIRASYNEDTITLYQAYNNEIATAAVTAQKLDASPRFRLARMTWVKPSWCWMMYRSGYARKDMNQARILALKMRRADFNALLAGAALTMEPGGPEGRRGGAAIAAKDAKVAGDEKGSEPTTREKSKVVKVQWDPERTPRLEKLGYRSLQVGIPGALTATWIQRWIVGIEDVTDKARALERELIENPDVTDEELVEKGLVPVEREYLVPEEVGRVIGMGEGKERGVEASVDK